MASSSRSSSSQACSWMLNISVREALVASVACTRPPLSFHNSQQSMVPKASSPRPARSRAPSMLSSSQASLVPEK